MISHKFSRSFTMFSLLTLSCSSPVEGPHTEKDAGMPHHSDASVPNIPGSAPSPIPDAPKPIACVDVGERCVADECCAGTTCASYTSSPTIKRCHSLCTKNSQCNSGCCIPLNNSSGGICAEASMCTPICDTGGDVCGGASPCCSSSRCITERGAMQSVCKDLCTANSQCYSGCCAPIINSTERVCSAMSFCL